VILRAPRGVQHAKELREPPEPPIGRFPTPDVASPASAVRVSKPHLNGLAVEMDVSRVVDQDGRVELTHFVVGHAPAGDLEAERPAPEVAAVGHAQERVLRIGSRVQPAGGGQAQQGSTASGGVTSSMTVVVTQCDAEYLKWLLQNAALTYTLGSYKDYQPQDTKVDPTCANAAAAKGVGPSQVDQRWHFTGI